MKNIEANDQKKKIIILGSGGHAKSVCDTLLALSEEYEVMGIVDRVKDENFTYENIRIIGTDDDLQQIYDSGIRHAIVGIGFLGQGHLRNDLVKRLHKIGFSFPVIIDPTAMVSKSADVGEGTFIGKKSVVSARTRIGKYCIINSCSLVEHDCQVGDFTHIAISACICGGVTIGEECLVGANATILQGKVIGLRAVIGAGAVVINDISADTTNVGNPAREVKK